MDLLLRLPISLFFQVPFFSHPTKVCKISGMWETILSCMHSDIVRFWWLDIFCNNVVFVPAHGCGEALLQQLWWSPYTGDVGIFFPPSWRRECRCAFYTSYPTTMVINLYRLHCCALCSFMRWEKKSCDSVHPEWKNLVAPSFQRSYSKTKIWVGLTTIVTGNVRLLIPPHVSSMKIFKHSCTVSSLVF